MHYDINKKIEQLATCKPARRKKHRRSLSLHEQVLSLVGQANSKVRPERHVVPRSALSVMNRALATLSTVPPNARRFAVLREVSKFITLHQNTFKAHNSSTSYADLLPIGHPLCSFNLDVDKEYARTRYAEWLAADSSLSDDVRSLVSTAYSLDPNSIQHKHAMIRLQAVSASVPEFLAADSSVFAYTFGAGNSSAARRARVALQWRDRKGRWVEMGRGANFRFRMPNGSVASASGVYVGVNVPRAGENPRPAGLIQVSGDANLPDGIYAVQPGNAETFSARVPTEALEKADITPGIATQQSVVGVPSQADILATRQDAPTGWTKQDDETFTSDDDYTVKFGDGEYTLWRQKEDGSLGDKVGDAANWAGINDLATADQASYDEVKGQGIAAGDDEQVKARLETRSEYNKEFDRLDEIANSGVDEKGNKLPEGWKGVVKPGALLPVERRAIGAPRQFGEEGRPYLEYERVYADDSGNPVVAKASYTNDGKLYANGKPYDSWDAAEADIPNWIKAEEDRRGRSLEPIASVPGQEKTENDSILDLPTEGTIEGTNVRYEIKTGPAQLGGRMRDGRIRNREREAVEGQIAGLYLTGDTSNLKLPELERNGVWRGPDGGDRSVFIERPRAPHPMAEDPVLVAKRLVAQLNEENRSSVADQEPPAVSKETLLKTPNVSTPSAPSLYKEFDVPNGAFQLRTIDYEPAGREDQESRNYTDDPEKLATRFPLPILTRALAESVIGDKNESIMDDIVDDTLDDNGDALDIEGAYDVADTPAPRAGRAQATGAGQLEFDAGDEFVPAEALYNAVFLAGGDPNRVIANAYDAVHGDRRNAEKLNQASGELPSPDEQQLVDDIMEEIRQIESSREPGDSPVSNVVDNPEPESELKGDLIYNNPIDWENPDYYTLDPNPYQATVPEPDENGYTDNPKLLATYFFEADLIQQLTNSITDGSGSAYFFFGTEETDYMSGTYEVPSEAIRDALQYRGVNTNTLLEDLKAEANNMEEKPVATPEPEPQPQVEAPAEPVAAEEAPSFEQVPFDGAISILTDWYDRDMLVDAEFIAYLPDDGSVVFKDAWDTLYVARADETIVEANTTVEWLTDPRGAGQAGWKLFTDEQRRSIADKIIQREQEAPVPAPAPTPAPTPTPESTPALVYPGPRERGYSPNNTTKVRGGAVVGKGSRVQAVKDGKVGTVVAIQNDPEYLRIKFDDGTTAVRAAAKVRAISNANGAAPQVVREEPQPTAKNVAERLDKPTAKAPRLARSGDTVGVNNESTLPEIINGLTNESAKQEDFSAWGTRDAEIAKAANDRITLQNLEKELAAYAQIDRTNNEERRIAKERLSLIMGDIYGARDGITFGGEFFSLTPTNVGVTATQPDAEWRAASPEDIANGKATLSVETALEVRDVTGNKIGDIRRTLTLRKKVDENGNVIGSELYAKNDYLALYGGGKKKGFATAFNRYTENWYIANGVEKVKVYAAGGAQYQGGFVWALNGFNWDPKENGPSVGISDFRRAVTTKEEERQVEELGAKIAAAKKPDGKYDFSKLPTPLEFALVGWKPGATDWVGKRVMIRESWNGVKHLTPAAREQVQAANYTQVKNAERRIESKQNIPNVSSNGLVSVESDKFRNDPSIAPYYTEIRDVLKNNRSLAVLSPDAKVALNNYVSAQLLDKNRNLPLEDVFRLRDGLGNEYRADYGYSDPFNSAETLSEFSVVDFFNAAENRSSTLKDAGFEVRQLSGVESGVNATFEVTHKPSGQVFYVKNDEFVSNFTDTPAGVTELEASLILRAAGMQGIHEVRVGKNDRNLIVMSRAGSNIPLVNEATNAGAVFRRGIKDPNGNNKTFYEPKDFIEALDTPEDLVRMSILDILGGNEDRHNGNWMLAFDQATGNLRMFPVDNTVGELKTDKESMAEFINYGSLMEADAYNDYMPTFVSRVGTDGMMKIYENEVNNVIKNLDNPLYQPKGFELDKIIEKWGSYDAFKDAMSSRLKKLITNGSDEYEALKGAMSLGYWR